MCIEQILMPYWESLTLLLKCHYAKITVWVWLLRCCWKHHVGYSISGSHLPQCLSPLFHCLKPAREGPEQYENDYWETVESHLLLCFLPSFLHPTSFHGPKPKTVSGEFLFHTIQNIKSTLKIPTWFPNPLNVTTIKAPCFLTHLSIVQTSILVCFQTNNDAFLQTFLALMSSYFVLWSIITGEIHPLAFLFGLMTDVCLARDPWK